MMWRGSDWGWAAWLAMTVMMVAFWGLLIWAVLALGRSGERRRDSESTVADRFPLGEIVGDEHRRRPESVRSPHMKEDRHGEDLVRRNPRD